MSRSTVVLFSETTATMTNAEGLAFIERTRRQLDRFECLPGGADSPIALTESAAIARLCDELEASIQSRSHHTS